MKLELKQNEYLGSQGHLIETYVTVTVVYGIPLINLDLYKYALHVLMTGPKSATT